MSQLPANPQDLLTKFQQSRQRAELAGPDGDYAFLKLTKGGSWEYGADEIEVEEGSIWAINPASLATGFAAWDDTEKVGEEMALLTEAPVLKHQLPDVGASWAPQVAMQLRCMDGEDEGTEVLWNTTSKGGQKAFKALLAAITHKLNSGSPEIIPMVTLETDNYKHKKYGKIYTPVFKVVDWMGTEALPQPDLQEEVEEEEVPAPKRRAKAKPEPEEVVDDAEVVEDAEEEEAPRRRRRRRN